MDTDERLDTDEAIDRYKLDTDEGLDTDEAIDRYELDTDEGLDTDEAMHRAWAQMRDWMHYGAQECIMPLAALHNASLQKQQDVRLIVNKV